MNRALKNKLFLQFTSLVTFLCCCILVFLLSVIFVNGVQAINMDFLFTESKNFGADGGIFYQLIGSLFIVTGAALLSFPIAIGAALCSSEYMPGKMSRIITNTVIHGLNGTPSIIFGIFGLIFFVNFLNTGISWFVGSIVLACMILPTILVSSLQSMNSIPQIYRESASALGLNKWEVILSVVIPQSFSGALSGLFIGLARAVGETAPIMFIATVFSGVLVPRSFFEPVTTLPTHILALTAQATNPRALTNAWGAILVLIMVVFLFSISSMLIRMQFRGAAPK